MTLHINLRVNIDGSAEADKYEDNSLHAVWSNHAGHRRLIRYGNSSSSAHALVHEKGENNATLALSKLTNRLNFLKEHQTQIAHELQHLGKTSLTNLSKTKKKVKSESHHPDKVQASQSQTSGKNVLDDGQSLQHPDLDKENSNCLPNTEKGPAAIPTRTNSR
ncbi:hypothetical protein CQW23_07357 [Capsicum baccatum]|uniref:Uncharacterized protein n=1 Tax=Capsicum baccatum TaxID=33114 RepID=A0A2G2X5W2_CAPBA|nr:hypothetical protein CQW23_07357 [Capsicum baccatum]